MTPIDIPWTEQPHHHCFGCSPQNETGLRLRFEWHGDEGLSTTFCLQRAYESYPGIVHGGLVGVICDETMGNLILLRTGMAVVTTSMRVRYIAPLAIDAEYRCVATMQADSGNGLVRTAAEVLDAAGEVMAAASATYRLTGAAVGQADDGTRQRANGEADATNT